MAAPILSDLTRRGLLASAGALAVAPSAWAQSRVTVFAAASLKPALDDIAQGWDVALSYGGSGAIARQVAAGAPADVVVLAATDWMEWLAGQGVLDGAPVSVASNRLVLAAPPGSDRVALTVAGLMTALDGGRLAMGDPMSVPAGRYAQQAFESLGLWDTLAAHLILTEDVRAALAYVARGDVALGAVYGSDTVGSGVEVVATFQPGSHAPIVYPAAQVSARPEAAAFLAHLVASDAVFRTHGFAS